MSIEEQILYSGIIVIVQLKLKINLASNIFILIGALLLGNWITVCITIFILFTYTDE